MMALECMCVKGLSTLHICKLADMKQVTAGWQAYHSIFNNGIVYYKTAVTAGRYINDFH